MELKEGKGLLRGPLAACFFLFSISALLYLKTINFDFLPSWDDDVYVINNPYILTLNLENLGAIFSTTFLGNYTPLQILSYAIDRALWGMRPGGFHFTNLILHGVNSVLAYLMLQRLAGRAAFPAALVFAVHPLNVENVAWVAERKTLLASLFSFLAIISYLKFRTGGRPHHYILCWLLFIGGILSKPSTVALPLVLLACEVTLMREERRFIPAAALLVGSVAGSVVAVMAHMHSGSIEEGTLTLGVLFGDVYPTMVPVYWKYMRLVILPLGLSGLYDTARYTSFLEFPVLVSLLAWTAVFAAVFLRGSRQVRFWFLWFWIWLLPVANIIPIPVYFADRYMYLPAIGLFVIAAAALYNLEGRLGPAVKTPVTVFIAAAVVFYGALSFSRIDVWRNDLTFWRDTAARSPRLYKARLNLGYAYDVRGLFREAEREYLAAIAIDPTPEAISNLVMVRQKMKYLEKKGHRPFD